MVLAFDIGNTTITVGGFSNGVLTFCGRISSDRKMSSSLCTEKIRELLSLEKIETVEGSIISSVVPELTHIVEKAVSNIGPAPFVVTTKMDTGLEIEGYDITNLGCDRIVDCVSALSLYKPPVIVFDLGTAITLSVLNNTGVFVGGMILPGIGISKNALSAQASQLPNIELELPDIQMGTDTVSCMQLGILHGTASIIEGLSQRAEEYLEERATVVLTGGYANAILPCLRREVHYEKHLMLKGLYYLYLRQIKNK